MLQQITPKLGNLIEVYSPVILQFKHSKSQYHDSLNFFSKMVVTRQARHGAEEWQTIKTPAAPAVLPEVCSRGTDKWFGGKK